MLNQPKVRRVNPEGEFPKWEAPRTGAGFLFGAVLWILMVIIFVVFAYLQLLSLNLKYLLNLVHPKAYHVPFWFLILVTIFLFPITLGIILIGTLIRIIKD